LRRYVVDQHRARWRRARIDYDQATRRRGRRVEALDQPRGWPAALEQLPTHRPALSRQPPEARRDRPGRDTTRTERRARFAERRLDALTWLCEHALREGYLMALTEYAGEVLDSDNLRERIHRHLMRAHYALGERGLAIRLPGA